MYVLVLDGGDVPQIRRRGVADDSVLTSCQDRRRLARILGEGLVAGDVYPSMNPMKETTIGASPNPTVLQPGLNQLSVRHGPVL
jgi:hypothetical protein